ncbi:OmpA family protein [Nafulsella turpanensis]|uniref:OmpA family protein n=1 Tax=Nafulsella turpanensis TaxID=1265690 RepID=UPI00034714C9|nr:OmpA family protein [Nafulsella turpanensis]
MKLLSTFFKLLLTCVFFFASSAAFGQNEQWATKVLDYSSQISETQYSAQQALRAPNVLPAGGENPNAWTPDRPNRQEFIKVGFDEPARIRQIAIAESYNPSAISEVYAYDKEGNEYLIERFSPEAVPSPSRMLNIYMERTDYEVAAVKVVLNGKALPGYHSIDAIGISKSRTPITVDVKVAADVNPDIRVQRLGETVNSEYEELKPLLSPDGNTLFFSRRNHPSNVGGEKDPEDIWFSEKNVSTGEWTEAENVGAPLNNLGPNYISSITPDGNTMLLLLGNRYGKNGKMSAGVSMSYKDGDQWSKPVPIDIENEYNFSDHANFFLAQSRKVLLMSVQRDDTYGDRDLYVSFLEEDSTWSEPKNIGEIINTAGTESAPFLAADGRTLYFSSNGFSGYGSQDIYVTRRLDDTWTSWTEPENLGPSINSDGEDIFFNIPLSGEQAYYSRGTEDGQVDIYQIDLPVFYKPAPVVVVKGKVFNAKTNEPLGGVKIFYERLSDGVEVGIARSESNGEYQIILPYGERYGYLAEAEDFVAISANINLTQEEQFKEIKQDLYLVPIEVGSRVTINNIFFDFDKATLRNESYPELNRLLEFMNNYPNVKIRIQGHTDSVGPEDYNQQLSERRADAVARFLQVNGVSNDRIIVEGLGEAAPVASNDTNEGRQENRRVEFEIIENSETPASQE